MARVHELAVVAKSAQLADDVVVGPFCYIEDGVVIGAGTKLDSHATVKTGTSIGKDNFIGQGAIIGGDPQDRKYKGEPTFLEIGDGNWFREYVTIHRATGEGQKTIIGSDCMLMAYVHIGHNVVVHDGVTMANNVGVSGHCTIEPKANIGGMTGVHQWVRIGTVAMIGGMSAITRDAPPFMITEGRDQVHDINAIGLRRIGLDVETRMGLRKACKLLFKSQLGLTNAIETVRRELKSSEEIEYLLAFEERRFQGKNGRGDQP